MLIHLLSKLKPLGWLIGIVSLYLLPAVQAAPICYNNNGYDTITASLNFDIAARTATSNKHNGVAGRLVIINDADEQAFLEKNLFKGFWDIYWIGSSNPFNSWITKESFSYTNWSNDEPNINNYGLSIGGDGYHYKWSTQKKPQTLSGYLVEYPNSCQQTITFNPPLIGVVGDSFKLNAIGGNSGNSVTFATTTPAICIVSESNVTLLAAGTCTITANQIGNANYNNAPSVTANITVNNPATPAAFICYQNNGYETIVNSLTFDEAVTAAASQIHNNKVGRLVTINDANEQAFIENNLIQGTWDIYWIGGQLVDNLASWLSGEAFSYSNWSNNEPSLDNHGVSIGGSGYAYRWSTQLNAGVLGGFIVEYPAACQQTITFNPMPMEVIGSSKTLSATGGNSGNPVIFETMTPDICSITDSNIQFLATGTCTITANQAGNAEYSAAPLVTADIMVVPICYKNNNYETIMSLQTFDEAETSAESRSYNGVSGRLVTINDADEQDFITNQLLTQDTYYWIGGQQIGEISSWITGESFDYKHWASDEPNPNYYGLSIGKNSKWYTQASTQILAGSIIEYSNSCQQIITFNPTPTGIVGRSETLIASGGNSGNKVLLETTTPAICTVSEGQVDFLAAGVCAITANQDGNLVYNAASPVTAVITVNYPATSAAFICYHQNGYETVVKSLTFDEAVIAAASYNDKVGHLVIIDDADEQAFLAQNLIQGDFDLYWIGNKLVTNLSYQNWSSNEPNVNNYGVSIGGSSYAYQWSTQPKERLLGGYIIEYPDACKQNQGLIFNNLPLTGVVGSSVILSATGGNSGNPVLFETATPTICSVSESKVNLLARGICTVTANQAGNADYLAAPPVTANILVSNLLAPICYPPESCERLTIQIDNKTRKYGQDNPLLTFSSSEPLATPPTLVTTATTESPPGDYAITCSGDHYSCQAGVLTILPIDTFTILDSAIRSDSQVIFKFNVQPIYRNQFKPTGSVTISADTVPLCQGTLETGFCLATLVKAKVVTAVYSGDAYFQSSYAELMLAAGYDSWPPPQSPLVIDKTAGLTIKEIGSSDLTVDLVSITGDKAEAFQILNSHLTISDGGPAQTITLECTARGAALLTLSTNDPRQPFATYPLTCVSSKASTLLDFGNHQIGQSTTFDLKIDRYNFTLKEEEPANTFQITVADDVLHITCVPSQVGIHTAILELTSDEHYYLQCYGTTTPMPGYVSQPSHENPLVFTESLVGQANLLDFQILETGELPLEVTIDGIYGPQADNFKLLSPASFIIPDGGSPQLITLQCLPKTTGQHTATLKITSNDPNHSQLVYPLECLSNPPPTTLYTSNPPPGSSLSFGSALIGQATATKILIVQQMGAAPLEVNSSYLTGPQANDFSLLPDSVPFSLDEVTNSHVLSLQCQPSGIGERQATLVLTTNDSLLPQVNYELRCQGLTETPVITDIQLSSLKIPAHTARGKRIGELKTLSNIPQPQYTYTLVEDPTGLFTIRQDDLYLGKSLDPANYPITIRSTEEHTQTSLTKSLMIEVLAENHPPTDIQLSNTLLAKESLAGTLVGQLTTLDPDNQDTHTYTLSSSGQFILTSNNEIRVAEGIKFKEDSYLIKVTSTDTGGLSLTKAFSITITHATFTGEIQTANGMLGSQASIEAPQVITLIGKIQPASAHLNQLADLLVAYRWTPATGGQPLNIPFFSITKPQPLSEQLTLRLFQGRLLGLAGTLEVELGYRVGQELLSSPILTLEILQNHAPTDIELSNPTIIEHSPADTLIATLTTHDPDIQEEFIYSLPSNPHQQVKIVNNELRTTDWPFDFEQTNHAEITIRSTDMTGAFIDKTFTLQIQDLSTTPTEIRLTRTSLLENTPLGTVVGRFSTLGRESDDYHYTLLNDAEGHFALQDQDLLIVADELDFEQQSDYQVTVRSQGIHHSLEQTLTIQLENEPDIAVNLQKIQGERALDSKEPVTLHLQVTPDLEHRGLPAEWLTVAEVIQGHQASWKKLVGTTWQTWEGDLVTLEDPSTTTRLPSTIEVDLPIALKGDQVNIYIGYRLADSRIIYSRQPLVIQTSP